MVLDHGLSVTVLSCCGSVELGGYGECDFPFMTNKLSFPHKGL